MTSLDLAKTRVAQTCHWTPISAMNNIRTLPCPFSPEHMCVCICLYVCINMDPPLVLCAFWFCDAYVCLFLFFFSFSVCAVVILEEQSLTFGRQLNPTTRWLFPTKGRLLPAALRCNCHKAFFVVKRPFETKAYKNVYFSSCFCGRACLADLGFP